MDPTELIAQLLEIAFAVIPPRYIAGFVVLVVALRTALRLAVWGAKAFGQGDRGWAQALDKFDSAVDWGVISALLPKPGGKGAQAVAVATRAITSRFPSQAPVLGADKEHEK